MTTKPRLRLSHQKRERRGFLSIFLVVLLGVAVWQLDEVFGIAASLKALLGSFSVATTDVDLPRGIIYDRNLKQVASTLDRVSVYARTQELKSIPTTVQVLGDILSLDEKELQQQLEGGALRVWLAEDISLEQEIAIRSKRLPGVYLQKEEKRFYPNGSQAAHLIGYAEKGIGLAGIEHYYDRLLANRQRRDDGQSILNSPQDLVLTLDMKIQDILDKLVEDITRQGRVRQVIAYIVEDRTGAIIGGAQFPGFDPNSFTKYAPEVLNNRFVTPILLPEKFRFLLRDSALLHAPAADNLPWSVRASESNLGGQLRFWEWLGINEAPIADFHLVKQPGKLTAQKEYAAVTQSPQLQMVPERATPFHIITAFSAILNEGKKVRPFVAQKSRDEAMKLDFLPDAGDIKDQAEGRNTFALQGSSELLRSVARQGVAKSAFFHDEILVSTMKGTDQHLFINELLLVALPAGGNDLNLIMVVEREPDGPHPRNGKKTMTLEQLVEEKVERFSILQQVAKSVADVVEPEQSEDGNYQKEEPQNAILRKALDMQEGALHAPAIMPDLRGESLRKSLRMLQGMYVKINIRGTGRVIAQTPPPGTQMKEISECSLVLQSDEDMVPEKLSKGALRQTH